MVQYTFCCRRCTKLWSEACAGDITRLIKCPSCGHDRIDYDVTHPKPPPASERPFVLGSKQRLLLVLASKTKGVGSVALLAHASGKSKGETHESLKGLAVRRFIELSDDGDVRLTDLGWLLAANIREVMKGGA